MATVTVYRGNAKAASITISGLSSLDGYEAHLVVVDEDGEEQFDVTGSISGLDITFNTTTTHNYLTGDTHYFYEVYITNGTLTYTVDKGLWFIEVTHVDHDPT